MGDKGELEKELRRLRWQLLSGACLSLLGVMYLINWADPDLAAARLLGPACSILGVLLVVSAIRGRQHLRRKLEDPNQDWNRGA